MIDFPDKSSQEYQELEKEIDNYVSGFERLMYSIDVRSPLGLILRVNDNRWFFRWRIWKWLVYVSCHELLAKIILWFDKPFLKRELKKMKTK